MAATQQLDPQSLLDQLKDLRLRLEAKERRIDFLSGRIIFLERRLFQRRQKTLSFYERAKPNIETMKSQIMGIFIEMPEDKGVSHKEIVEEFSRRFPKVSTKNVPRRVCELREEGKLWSCQDEAGTVRFYLKLKE